MSKKISFQIFIPILTWTVILWAVIAHFIHLAAISEQSALISYLATFQGTSGAFGDIEHLYLVGLAGLLMITGFLLFLTLSASVKKRITVSADTAQPLPKNEDRPSLKSHMQVQKEQQVLDQRRALHLLSLLQREGRLVDFLEEDLSLYEDAQIGAAVRSIHENCQKKLHECLSLTAVIDREEGEEVTIEAGFDPNAVKLTGHVTGNPPFSGILQHRGWQAKKIALPELSTGPQNPNIIAPAEVEIKLVNSEQ